MLELIDESVAAGETFAIETTLSSRNYLKQISRWKEHGYQVLLIFISLDTPELATRRVAQRVAEGGHHIPTSTIIRRFHRGRQHFPAYCEIVNEWYSYLNSDGTFHLTNKGWRQ